MLVSPLRNHSNSCTIDFSGSFLVVNIGNPAARLKRIWWPKIDNVPVPVRSAFSAPSERIRSSRSWYWFMATSGAPRKESFSGRNGQSTAAIRPVPSIIPGKISIRLADGKGGSVQWQRRQSRFSPDHAGKTQDTPGQQQPKRAKPRAKSQHRCASGHQRGGKAPIGA